MPLKETAQQCKAIAKKTGKRCCNPAVLTYSVCRLHGAGNKNSPSRDGNTKHGRYSKFKTEKLRSLIEEYENDPDPLNILPELAAARALFQDFTDRYDEWREAMIDWHQSFGSGDSDRPQSNKPTQILDISDAYRIVSEITKIVERIEKIRSQNAISRPDLVRVMTEMSRVVQAHVTDATVLEKIKTGWLTIRV